MLTLDFAEAKLRHTTWKLRLRRFLDGEEVLTEAQAIDHHACEVGRWLAAPGSGGFARWGQRSELSELDAAHRAMHAAVRRVIEARNAGRMADAERAFDEADGHARAVVTLLTSIEGFVAAGGKSAA